MRITVEQGCRILNQGDVVALPTETVYGLAASLHHPQAIEKVFLLKGRPSNNPLIIHLSQPSELHTFVTSLPQGAEKLMEAFWPGPLTLVLPIHLSRIDPRVRSHLPTAAFRIPAHPLTRDVIQKSGPLVMPSANLSGRPSSTCPEHVEDDFGTHFPVLDGGSCSRGMESTIVIYRSGKWEIIRLGSLTAEQLAPCLGYTPQVTHTSSKDAPICPGQLYRHYSPKTRLTMCHDIPHDAVGVLLGFKERCYPKGVTPWHLGSLDSPESVAENLYGMLRRLDEQGVTEAWVDGDLPQDGLWDTIRERLTKASTR